MKKLVIKTVFITVMAILTISIAVMSAICVFKPKVIAKMFDNLGNYQASQYFYLPDHTRFLYLKIQRSAYMAAG